MDELAKLLRHFIYRDIIYITGGSIVVICFCYMFDLLKIVPYPTAYYIFLAGFAYVIGFALQEIISLTGFITTGKISPRPLLLKVYEKWAGEKYTVNNCNMVKARIMLYENGSERSVAGFERIITLKHIGSTMGSCMLVSSILIFIKAINTKVPFDLTLAIITLLGALSFSCINRLHSIRYNQYLYDFVSNNKNDEHH